MPDDFKKIPGSPVAYWASSRVRTVFENLQSVSAIANPVVGFRRETTENFYVLWHEVEMRVLASKFKIELLPPFLQKNGSHITKAVTTDVWFGNQDGCELGTGRQRN